MRMMDASMDLLQLPATKQLILDDPQLLLLKLRHSLTLVDCVSIGASCQRVSELLCLMLLSCSSMTKQTASWHWDVLCTPVLYKPETC